MAPHAILCPLLPLRAPNCDMRLFGIHRACWAQLNNVEPPLGHFNHYSEAIACPPLLGYDCKQFNHVDQCYGLTNPGYLKAFEWANAGLKLGSRICPLLAKTRNLFTVFCPRNLMIQRPPQRKILMRSMSLEIPRRRARHDDIGRRRRYEMMYVMNGIRV